MRWSEVAPRAWRLGPLAPGRLLVDPDRLRAALDALLENAVKFTRRARRDRAARARRRAGPSCVIEVEDEGCGRPPGGARADLRPVRAGRRGADAVGRRGRPGARDRRRDRQAPRRPLHGREHRPRVDVRAAAAGLRRRRGNRLGAGTGALSSAGAELSRRDVDLAGVTPLAGDQRRRRHDAAPHAGLEVARGPARSPTGCAGRRRTARGRGRASAPAPTDVDPRAAPGRRTAGRASPRSAPGARPPRRRMPPATPGDGSSEPGSGGTRSAATPG